MCMHSKMKLYKENKLLLVLAGILVLAHAVIPHTHHFSFFSSVVDLLGEDFKEQFEHHNPTTDKTKECYCSYRFDYSDSDDTTGLHLKKTNDKKEYVLDYQPSYMVDNPPDITCETKLLSLFNPNVAFNYTDCIVLFVGLRAPPFVC